MGRFVVSGIFETGMYEYDVGLVYISIPSCPAPDPHERRRRHSDKNNRLFRADQISRAVKDSLGGYPYRAMDWKSQNKSLFDWMRLGTPHYIPGNIADYSCCGFQYYFFAHHDDPGQKTRNRDSDGHGGNHPVQS